MVTSPSCSATSFTFGSSSGVSSLFPLAAAAKLTVERMLAAWGCATRGEGGSDMSPLRVKGDRGTPARSAPWRELLRDIGCWPTRSFVASRSLSRRSAIAFSLAVTSTGLDVSHPVSTQTTSGIGDTNLAAPNGLGRLAGLLWVILGEARGDDGVELFPERGKSSSFRRVIWGVGGVDDVALLPHEKSILREIMNDLRDVLLRDEKPGRGPLLQSPSASESGALGGPMSPRPLNVPNLRPGPSSSLGLNLLPIVHVSSLSAAPAFSNAEFLRLEEASGSGGGGGRDGRLERQSLEVSETEGAAFARSVGSPSLRR